MLFNAVFSSKIINAQKPIYFFDGRNLNELQLTGIQEGAFDNLTALLDL